jgi:phosphohistidine phosphatase
MKALILMRHGPAGNREKLEFEDDGLRPLTDKGRKVVRTVARRLRKQGLLPDLILTSPLVRARETAEIVADVLEPSCGVVHDDALVFGTPIPVVVDTLARHFEKAALILAVGHETDLSQLASTLVSGRPHSAIEIRKGGWCLLTFQDLRAGKCAILRALVNPRPMQPKELSADKEEVK